MERYFKNIKGHGLIYVFMFLFAGECISIVLLLSSIFFKHNNLGLTLHTRGVSPFGFLGLTI